MTLILLLLLLLLVLLLLLLLYYISMFLFIVLFCFVLYCTVLHFSLFSLFFSLYRYIDDEFVYGIDGLVFNDTGASIPLEPMYLILNTAVSSTWGFPNSADCPRPRDGSDSCFDCRNKECDCYVPRGMCGNLPAYLLIDYIRVYQDTSKGSKHTTGK